MTFTLGGLRNSPLILELSERCRSHSILISPSPRLSDGGSGTLVKYKNLYGILGATHVISQHTNSSSIFSPILRTLDPTYFLNVEIPVKAFIYLETPDGIEALQGKNWPEGALDICLIQLDPLIFDFILQVSGKKAVDLQMHKTKYLKDFDKYCAEERCRDWIWAVDGAPRQGSTQDFQGVLISKFDGLYLCGGSKHGSTFKTQQLTLVSSPFDNSADLSCHDLGPTADLIPSQFGGISGGGMWQVSFSGSEVPEAIDEMFFSGVCVAGIAQECLYARGPSSLYDIFTNYLDNLSIH